MKGTRKKRGGEVSAAATGASQAETFARNLLTAWNTTPGLPDWLNDALVDAVAQTAAHFDLPNPFAEPQTEEQIAPLARLIAHAGPTFSLRELRARIQL